MPQATFDFQGQFLADVAGAVKAMPRVTIDLEYEEAIVLIAQLQLALRHPTNTGHAAHLATTMAMNLIDAVALTPVIRRGLALGFDSAFDATASQRRCRYCGCTDARACRDDGSGKPCHWVDAEVCSNPACVAAARLEEGATPGGADQVAGPARIIRFDNGTVAALDVNGHHMPQFEGRWVDLCNTLTTRAQAAGITIEGPHHWND